jgi:hypothetical protein
MEAQDDLPTAAQHAVEQAMLVMLFPRATAAELLRLSRPPPWICKALQRLVGLAGVLLRDQHRAPRRAELADRVAALQDYIERLPPIISVTLDQQLALRPLLDRLSRRGGFALGDMFGEPSAKLVIACAVTALHLTYTNYLPSERNPCVRALCAALLVWAAEKADVPMPEEPDARRTQWGHPLRQARASVLTADPYRGDALSFAWGVVRVALQPIADHASFNPAAGCSSGSI